MRRMESRSMSPNSNARWRGVFFTLLIGIGSSAGGILLDLVLGIENRPILYSDVFTGAVAALLAFLVARYYERLRQSDVERLEVAADVNHHVRNALTMVLYSVHAKRDPELIRVTQDAVNRIDKTLRDVLWQSNQPPSTAASGMHRSD